MAGSTRPAPFVMSSTLSLHAAPAAGFDQPFEMLHACHDRVRRMLDLLGRLRVHLQEQGADRAASQAAQDLLRYFDQAAPQHHEDEERHVLPLLRASGEPACVALAQRLQDDHRAMSAAWALMHPALVALMQGQWVADHNAAAEWALWQRFADLYAAHIEAEEGQAFPWALASTDDLALAAMGREMAARRGVESPRTL